VLFTAAHNPDMNKPKETMRIIVQTVGDFLSDVTK